MSESLLVVTDVDSTLIRDEVIELIADSLGAQARNHVADVTERAMRGELDFAASLSERLLVLQGVPTTVFADVVAAITVTEGVEDLIAEVHARDGRIAAVSGGFHEVLDPLAERLEIDYAVANRLETADGVLTGRSTGTVVDAAVKRETLIALANDLEIPIARTMAVGDGANDLLMIEQAGIGVAFCAKPVLREAADVVIEQPDFRLLIPHLP